MAVVQFNASLGAIPAAGLAGIIAGFGVLGKAVFSTGMKMDAFKNSMIVSTGSVALAEAEISKIKKLTDTLGLNFLSTADAYKKFSIAAKEVGMASATSDKVFRSVAKSSAAMGLSAENTRLTLKALEQMISKGTVQSEELRGQLGEHLPGAFGMAAQAMNITTMQLSKMLEQGEILAVDLLPKLADVLENRFASVAVRASKQARAQFERMKNAWVEFLVVFGQTGVYAGIESAIVAITGQLKKLMVAINAGEITRAFSQLKIEFEFTMLYLKGIQVLWLRFTALVLNTMVSIDKEFNVFFKLKQTFLNLKVAYLGFADVVMNWIAAFDRELTKFWNAWTYGSKKATASIQAYAAIVTAKLGDAIRASSKHWDEHRDGVDQTSKGLQELADKAKGAAKEATDEWEKGWSDFNNPIDEAIVSTKQLKNELTALEAVWVNSSGADEQITSLKFFDDFNNKRFMNEMGEMSRETKDITQLSADFIDGFSTGITDELAEALATGKMDFADFARSILMDINKMIIKMLIFKAIMGVVNAVGGMFGGAAAGAPGASQAVGNIGSSGALSSASVFGAGSVASFGSSVAPSAFESAVGIGGNMVTDFSSLAPTPTFAKGGSVSGGRAIIVGEQGREVFVPDSDGQIIPNHNINKTSSGQGSESGDTINVTLNLSTGVQQTVRAEIMGMMPVITKQVKGAVAEARQRGGSFSSQMGVA
jgi:tape measure domain-containing protein